MADKNFEISPEAQMSKLPSQHIMGGFSIDWSEELSCFIDYMGLPLSRSDAMYLMERAAQHLQHSVEELGYWRYELMAKNYPSMLPESSKER